MPERKTFRLEQWRRVLLFFTFVSGLALVVASVLLFPSFLPMFFEKKELEKFVLLREENYLRTKTGKSLAEVKAIKGKLAGVKNFIEKGSQTSSLVEEVLQTAAESRVTIRQFNLTSSGEVLLGGTALGRRELLLFEDKLKGLSRFAELSSPLSDIIRGASSFTIQGKINPVSD